MFIIVELINIKNIVDKQPYNKLMHINSNTKKLLRLYCLDDY